ncbi:MAG: hypothetical protein ACLQGP_40600 [Isosphaeraceae bacterium]
MVKVLTIRDPKTGVLIAKDRLRPKEDTETAVARVFRETLGPDAPEQMVNRSVSLMDREWAAELARDWDSFRLMLVGPKGDPDLQKWHLVLARVSEREPLESRLEKSELHKIREGQRHDAVVPAIPEDPPLVGDRVRFVQARYDPFGEFLLVPNGDSILVELTEVKNQGSKWAGHDLYYIAWDPSQFRKSPKKAAAKGSK